jgi:hypothetical protein
VRQSEAFGHLIVFRVLCILGYIYDVFNAVTGGQLIGLQMEIVWLARQVVTWMNGMQALLPRLIYRKEGSNAVTRGRLIGRQMKIMWLARQVVTWTNGMQALLPRLIYSLTFVEVMASI